MGVVCISINKDDDLVSYGDVREVTLQICLRKVECFISCKRDKTWAKYINNINDNLS